MKLLFTATASLILFTGCVSNQNIRSGGLNIVNTNIPNHHLMYHEISTEEINYSTVFGIQQKDVELIPTQTTIVNFNGSNPNSYSANFRPLQIVSFVLSSASVFLPFSQVLSDEVEIVLAGLGSLLFGGLINEAAWRNYHAKNAFGEVNNLLIQTNSDIDYYINPTYNISTYSAPFNSTRSISGKAIGIEISDSLFHERVSFSNLNQSVDKTTPLQETTDDLQTTLVNNSTVTGSYFPNKKAESFAFKLLDIALLDGEKRIKISYEISSKEKVELWVDPWSDKVVWLDKTVRQEVIDF